MSFIPKTALAFTVALLGTTGLAVAQDTLATEDAFGVPEVQSDNMLIVLPLVTATADGVVEIRPVVDDRADQVLGSHVVTAGANENVRVSVLQKPLADAVMAVLVIDGQDVAMQQIQLSPPGSSN
jgi:hypothetical protein